MVDNGEHSGAGGEEGGGENDVFEMGLRLMMYRRGDACGTASDVNGTVGGSAGRRGG